jgi:outer membrane protein assembly factor BamB
VKGRAPPRSAKVGVCPLSYYTEVVTHAASTPSASSPSAARAAKRARALVCLLAAVVSLSAVATRAHAQTPPPQPPLGELPLLPPGRDGKPVPDPRTDLSLVLFPGDPIWVTILPSTPAFAPAFDGESAYALLRDETLVSLSTVSGAVNWTAVELGSLPPVAAGGLVAGVTGQEVWLRDGASGSLRWRRALDSAPVVAPEVVESGVVLALQNGDVVCLRRSDGGTLWTAKTGAAPPVMTSAPQGPVVVGQSDGTLLAFSAANGEPLWSRKLGGRVLTLSAVDARVYAGTVTNLLFAIDLRRGDEHWRWRTGGDPSGPVAARDNRLAEVAMDSTLRLHNRRTGSLLWKQAIPSRPLGGPVFLHDRIVQADISFDLRGYDVRTGAAAGVYKVGDRLIHQPHVAPTTSGVPARLVLLTWSGLFLAVGRPADGVKIPLGELPGTLLAPETAADCIVDPALASLRSVLVWLLPPSLIYPIDLSYDDPPVEPMATVPGKSVPPEILLPLRLRYTDPFLVPMREPFGRPMPREVLPGRPGGPGETD